MVRHRLLAFALVVMTAGASSTAVGASGLDPSTLIAAQRKAMLPLSYMDGVWRGPAWSVLPSGEKDNITQTERIGPFLDGSVKVIEGRGYDPDGKVTFNVFATISYDLDTRVYTMCSDAQGRAGRFCDRSPRATALNGRFQRGRSSSTTRRSSRKGPGERSVTGSCPEGAGPVLRDEPQARG